MSDWRFTLLGYQAGFARPLMLLLLAAALAVVAVFWVEWVRRRRVARRLFPGPLSTRLLPGADSWRPPVRAGLSGAGLCLLAIALAQPQCGGRAELTQRRGIDVVVALDASKSMLARDVTPSRLERAKLELMTLLDELKGDRVALVVFAGEAFVQCPLTSDYAAAKLFLRAVDPHQMPQGGSNIGDALQLARRMLDSADRGAKERVVVLISDGEDLGGEVSLGARSLREAGIRVYGVGIGSESGEPIPIQDRRGNVVGYQKTPDGETVFTRLDREGLMALAEATGGEYFHQPRGVAMGQVVERIDRLQKSELESRLSVQYVERYQAYALPGALLLLLGMALATLAGRAR